MLPEDYEKKERNKDLVMSKKKRERLYKSQQIFKSAHNNCNINLTLTHKIPCIILCKKLVDLV